MTQESYFHNGSFRGDATLAAYNDVDFHKVVAAFYNNPITLSRNGNYLSSVNVNAGQCRIILQDIFIAGVYCDCDVTLSVPANPNSQPRFDTAVAKINWDLKQVEILIYQGIASSIPTPIELQQDFGDVWEEPLAYLYIPAGSAVDTLTYARIYELINCYYYYDNASPFTIPTNNSNIIKNGEFLSGPMTSDDGIAPAYWRAFGSPVITNSEYVPGIVPRNKYPLKVSLTSSDELYSSTYISATNSDTCTVALAVQVISGVLEVSEDGASTKEIYPSAVPLKFYIRYVLDAANDALGLSFTTSSTAEFYLWQVTLSTDWIAAPFAPYNEYVLYGYPKELLPSQSRANGTYESPIDAGKANLLRLSFGSGVSAGSTNVYAYVAAGKYLATPTNLEAVRTEVGQLPNAVFREDQGWITTDNRFVDLFYVIQNLTLGQFGLDSTGIVT